MSQYLREFFTLDIFLRGSIPNGGVALVDAVGVPALFALHIRVGQDEFAHRRIQREAM